MKREDAARVMEDWRNHALISEQAARDNGLPAYVSYQYITLPLRNPDGSAHNVYINAELLDACVEALTDVSEKAAADAKIAELSEINSGLEKVIVRLVTALREESVPVKIIGKVT